MINPATITAQVKDRTRRIIRADGTIEPLDIRGSSEPMQAIHMAIGASELDTVNLRHMGQPLMVMTLDDHGWECEERRTQVGPNSFQIERVPVRARKPINEIATALYHANCVPGTTHQIVGDVYVCPDEDFA